jgi:hypothetical protein
MVLVLFQQLNLFSVLSSGVHVGRQLPVVYHTFFHLVSRMAWLLFNYGLQNNAFVLLEQHLAT